MVRKIIDIKNETANPIRAKTLFLFLTNSPMMPRMIPTREAKNESIHVTPTIIDIHSDDGVTVYPEIYTEYAVAVDETISKIPAATLMTNDAIPNPECFFSSILNPVCNF
ncbi:MAG: hypothetical protein LBP54_05800 [Campylobacteraceae bacterium]|nr:hypothetical protein [Campylobacteraceae bacterium]